MEKTDYSAAASLVINTDIVAKYLSYHVGAAAGDHLLQFITESEGNIPIATLPEIFKAFGLTAMINFNARLEKLLLPVCVALKGGSFSILLRCEDNVYTLLNAAEPSKELSVNASSFQRHSSGLIISTQEEFSIFAHG